MRKIKVTPINPGKFLIDKLGSLYLRSLMNNNVNIKNPIKFYEYNIRHNIVPSQIINENDGTCTYIYDDGSVIRIKATVTELKDVKKLNLNK